MDNNERYAEARRLIENNQFSEARALLAPIVHEERAENWIRKIDAHLAKVRTSKPPVKANRSAPSWGIISTVLLAAFTFVAGLLIGGYLLDLSPEPATEPVQSVMVVTATPMPATETPVPSSTPIPTWTPVPTQTPVATEIRTSAPDSGGGSSAKWQLPTLTPIGYSGDWAFDTDVSALDDSTTYYIGLSAESSIAAWLSNPTPLLVVRCQNRQYEVFIHADTQLDSNLDDEVYTRVRYGDNTPLNVTMSESTTGEAMFFPNGPATTRSLLAVNRLVVGFTPFNANPVEAIFDLTGMETAIQPLFDACGRP